MSEDPDQIAALKGEIERLTARVHDAEQALRDGGSAAALAFERMRAMFRAVYEHASHFAGILSLDGRVEGANGAVLTALGTRHDQMLGRLFWETPSWSHSEPLQELVRDAVLRAAQGEAVCFEATHPVAGGALHPVECKLSPVTNDQGETILLLAECWDISRNRAVEASLSRTEHLLEAVIEQSPIAFIVVTCPDLVVRYSNRAAIRTLGLEHEPRLLNLPLTEVVRRQRWRDVATDGTPVPLEQRPLARALRGETVQRVDYPIVRSDGSRRHLLASAGPIYDQGRTLVAGVLILEDVTEQKQAEEQLRSMAQEQRTILDTTTAGIVLLKSHRIEWANRAFSAMFEYSLEELHGVDTARFYVGQDDFTRVGDAGYARLSQGQIYSTEALMQRKNGGQFWCALTGRALAAGQLSEGTIWVLQDITERKNAEQEHVKLQEQLSQALKMEAIGRLAGGVAHDFNNLLTVIRGNTELARSDLREKDPVLAYLTEILKASDSATSLTRQLLAFSRRQVIEPQPLDLNDLLNDLERMLRRLLGEDIELVFDLSKTPGTVHVDPGQFEQVIVNLAVNARDAMPNGGRLTVETTNVELDETYCERHAGIHPGPFVMLAVSDNGLGMSPEVKQRLFEPFFTTKQKGRGTGLGLATLFGIVKQSGGAIEVYSEREQGTTFKIYLPRLAAPPARPVRTSTAPNLPGGHETILLVEDEESIRNLTVVMLERLGYNVLVTSNGGDAVALVERREGNLELLLTDVVMPNMNGRELAEKLRQLRPGLPVLYTSGYTEEAIVQRGLFTERIQFIGKPFTLQTLALKVRQVLDAREPSGQAP